MRAALSAHKFVKEAPIPWPMLIETPPWRHLRPLSVHGIRSGSDLILSRRAARDAQNTIFVDEEPSTTNRPMKALHRWRSKTEQSCPLLCKPSAIGSFVHGQIHHWQPDHKKTSPYPQIGRLNRHPEPGIRHCINTDFLTADRLSAQLLAKDAKCGPPLE